MSASTNTRIECKAWIAPRFLALAGPGRANPGDRQAPAVRSRSRSGRAGVVAPNEKAALLTDLTPAPVRSRMAVPDTALLAFQDVRVELRRQWWVGPVPVTPFVGGSFPTHEYETVGEAVPGRHRWDLQAGASAGG